MLKMTKVMLVAMRKCEKESLQMRLFINNTGWINNLQNKTKKDCTNFTNCKEGETSHGNVHRFGGCNLYDGDVRVA